LHHLVGEVADDVPVALEASQQQRFQQPLQGGGPLRVALAFDGSGEFLLETSVFAEVAGVQELAQRPQLIESVLDGGAGERDAHLGGERAGGARLRGVGVLDLLRFVEDHRVPRVRAERFALAAQQWVAGDHELRARQRLGERSPPWCT
jgi:hypothetical protein